MDRSIADVSKIQLGDLNANKFNTWKFRVFMVLKGLPGARDVLEGRKPRPTLLPGATAEAKQKYEKEVCEYDKLDSIISVLLTSNLTDDILKKMMRFTYSKDMWDELHRLYGGCTVDRRYVMCKTFFSYKKDATHDMATHISTLKNLWYELHSAMDLEKDLPDILLIYKILDTLPPEYMTFESSWLLMTKNERTVDNLTVQLCSHELILGKGKEENDKGNEGSSTAEALWIKTGKKEVKTANKEESKEKSRKDKKKCKYCGKLGHFVRQCEKWISDGRPKKSEKDSKNVNMTILYITGDKAKDAKNFYVDNGATSHVTNNDDLFVEFSHFKSKHTVRGANGNTIQAVGIGTIRAQALVDGEVHQIMLKDVWYVPTISRNLFSVLAAHDAIENSTFESTPTTCIFKVNGEKRLIGKRAKHGDLYKLEMTCLKPAEINQLSTQNLLQLYHERFGHQSKAHVKKLLEKEMNIKTEMNKDLCEGCVYGKSHRLRFGTREKATRPGELICTDVCGPFPYSYGKKRYFVLFKDVHTRYRWVYMMREKSEVHQKLSLMLAEVKTAGVKVKEILSDNGGEFNNAEVRGILQKEGIVQRLTMPYTPQQNPTERENRTVVEMARAIMYAHGEMPEGLWAELISTSVYILNRTGPGPDEKSPYELWYGKKPRIKHLRVIGTTCYPHLPKEKRKKLDKKAEKGILIGYDGDEGYRIWDGEHHKLIRSRDVTFQEYPLLREADDLAETKSKPTDTEPENKTEQKKSSWSKNNKLNLEFLGFKYGYSKDIVVEGEGEVSVSDNEPVVNGEEEVVSDEEVVNDESTETEDRLNIGNNEVNDEDDDIAQGFQTGNEDVYDDTEDDGAQIPITETENEGRMTLRNRDNLRPPSRYRDFVCNVCHTLSKFDEPILEPTTYKQAIESVEADKWRKAMESEIKSLKDNQTWDMVALPRGRKAIPCKWIFKIKTNPDGTVDKYKARLVIKGYSQKKGLDYYQTFSPVAKTSTIRAILSVAAQENLTLSQFDVSTAFLYGSLNEEIYMKPPEGYNDTSGKVCKLKRSLYGLKQAPRCWNHCITEYILKIGFRQCESDPCLFVRNKDSKDKKLILALYVDDGLIASANPQESERFLCELRERFKITTKSGSYFLGIEIDRKTDGSIKIDQKGYAKRLLERFNMQNCKAAVTPIVKDANLQVNEKDLFPYRQAVGALSYLTVGTRPDIAYAVSVVSRTLDNPKPEDVARVKRIFRYIKGTIDHGITYQSSTATKCLQSFSDADHGGDPTTGKSTSGMVCLYSRGAIAWQSKRQRTVAISSTEAEIVAASETAREVLWLKKILEFMVTGDVHTELHLDSESAICLAHDPPYERHQRTKHIQIRHFFVRECVTAGNLNVLKVEAAKQLADFLTKPLFKPRIKELSALIGLT